MSWTACPRQRKTQIIQVAAIRSSKGLFESKPKKWNFSLKRGHETSSGLTSNHNNGPETLDLLMSICRSMCTIPTGIIVSLCAQAFARRAQNGLLSNLAGLHPQRVTGLPLLLARVITAVLEGVGFFKGPSARKVMERQYRDIAI